MARVCKVCKALCSFVRSITYKDLWDKAQHGIDVRSLFLDFLTFFVLTRDRVPRQIVCAKKFLNNMTTAEMSKILT